jgi:hypothetical protein
VQREKRVVSELCTCTSMHIHKCPLHAWRFQNFAMVDLQVHGAVDVLHWRVKNFQTNAQRCICCKQSISSISS